MSALTLIVRSRVNRSLAALRILSPARGSLILPWDSKLRLRQSQDSGSDGRGVQRIGLTDPPPVAGAHSGSFDDVIADLGYCPGQTCAIGADTLDSPQTPGVAVRASAYPGSADKSREMHPQEASCFLSHTPDGTTHINTAS